jgi:hypothetical protein
MCRWADWNTTPTRVHHVVGAVALNGGAGRWQVVPPNATKLGWRRAWSGAVMEPIVARAATSLVSSLATALGKPLARGALNAVLGTPEQRALNKACRTAVERVVEEADATGMTDDEVKHALALVERLVQARKPDGVPVLDVEAESIRTRAAAGQRLSHATTSCTTSITAQSAAANLGAHITSGTTAPNASSMPLIVLVKP